MRHSLLTSRPIRNILCGATRLGIALLLVAWLASDARACECLEYGTPPCAAYGKAAAVFVGVVAEITKVPPQKDDPYEYVSVRFLIEEPFRGVAGPEVKVITAINSACDLEVKRGERWVVYAYRDSGDDTLAMGTCSRTHQVDGDDEDLVYLRGLSKGTFRPFVAGIIQKQFTPLGDVRFTASVGGEQYEATSDAGGYFQIMLDKPGRYQVRAVVPFSAGLFGYDMGGVEIRPTDEQSVIEYDVNIPAGQCAYRMLAFHEIDLHATAELSGRVLDALGRPVGAGFVYLLGAGENKGRIWAKLDAEGRYKFESLASGRYLIVINPDAAPPDKNDAPYPRTFYPGVPDSDLATVVSLTEGVKLTGLDLQLGQPFKERLITGQVVWADGRPAQEARVWLRDATKNSSLYPAQTDHKGRFNLTAYEGFKYEIVAESLGEISGHGKRVAVPMTGELKPFKLVIKPER